MEGNTLDHCKFAIVQATIEKVDDSTVTFTARGTSAFGGTDQNLRRTFSVPRSEIYTAPIPGAPSAVALSAGATGNLYLSRTGWTTRTADGFTLFGAAHAVFKWPQCAGLTAPVLTRLSVIPTSIVVRGHLEDETAFFELELLGPDAATSQDITWNGVDQIALQLTPRGAQRLRVGSGWCTVRLWPTRITVKGAPAIDPSMSGEVDILDCEMAGGVQRIEFTETGSAVVLRLTQDGVNAFHVTPQLAAELLTDAETDAYA